MKQFTYTITDPVGIHARPAGMLVRTAKGYGDTVVTITRGETAVRASRLMKLMGLGVKQSDQVTVAAEEEAIAAMERFFKENL